MAMRVRRQQIALGYYADIPQAFWRRLTRYHVPVKWFACWLGGAIIQLTLAMTQLPFPWGWSLISAAVVTLGELGLLQWLTWADPQWDSLLTQRDCTYYEAD